MAHPLQMCVAFPAALQKVSLSLVAPLLTYELPMKFLIICMYHKNQNVNRRIVSHRSVSCG
jgi:hypothetical protein